MKKKSDYLERQIHIMSNLGLFYIIIVALFAIPLLGTFVVVIIKGVLDFQYVILAAGIILLGFGVFYFAKLVIRIIKKVRNDGLSANQEMKTMMARGEPFQISVLNGFLTFSYQNPNTGGMKQGLPDDSKTIQGLLPPVESSEHSASDVILQLKELATLKSDGVITDDEFQHIKTKLIHNLNEPAPQNGLTE